jgi:hypothetical protein
MSTKVEPRPLNPFLMIATVAVPAVFVWLFLRKGYSPTLRRAAFTYMAAMTAVGILASLPIRP